MATNILLSLEPDLQERLVAEAARQTRSPEFLLRDAVEEYLDSFQQQPVQLSQEELNDLEASREEYRRTGLHVTWEEVDEWLARLQNEERIPPPECHT